MGTCKLHDINPFIWLRDTLEHIAQHPINRIAELLPYHPNYRKLELNLASKDAKDAYISSYLTI